MLPISHDGKVTLKFSEQLMLPDNFEEFFLDSIKAQEPLIELQMI